MAKPINETKRRAILADLRRGHLTHKQVAERHGVGTRTVDKISAERRNAPTEDPLLARLDRLAASAERALELAEASDDGRELSAALRAAHETMKTVAKMRQDVERASEGGSRAEVEKIKRTILEELTGHPELRRRVAARLLGDTP